MSEPLTVAWSTKSDAATVLPLEQLEGLDDSDIGGFTALDWFFCIAGSIVIPVIALWWFAG